MNEWRTEKNELAQIDILGKGNEGNLNRFALFFTRTIDRIVDPGTIGAVLSSELFDIGEMLTNKMRNSSKLEFNTVMRHVNGLKNLVKYHIGLSKDTSSNGKLAHQLAKFETEKDRLAEKCKGQNQNVTKQENFTKTAVY